MTAVLQLLTCCAFMAITEAEVHAALVLGMKTHLLYIYFCSSDFVAALSWSKLMKFVEFMAVFKAKGWHTKYTARPKEKSLFRLK